MIALGEDRHTHSTWSDGADGLERMLEAARSRGLDVWGISDHVRAATTWAPDYVRAVRALRAEGLRIECGVEVKILDTSGRLDLPADLPELDHLLIADHRVPGSDGPLDPAEVGRRRESGQLTPVDIADLVLTATIAAVARSPFPPILAHFLSVLPKCGIGEDDVPPALLDDLAAACLTSGARVEVNEKWRCPGPSVVSRLRDAGVAVIAGSDAHRAEQVGVYDYVRRVSEA